jgi:type VI protein secretion system component Hcp
MISRMAKAMRKLSSIALAAVLSMAAGAQGAVSEFLYLPGITGEDSTPGFPGAIAVQSLTVTNGSFSIVKNVDIASPTIFNDVVTGAALGTANILLYNGSTSSPPSTTLTFPGVHASNIMLLPNGITEQDGFSAITFASMFLELPGIVGESSIPGHPGVTPISSFSLTANNFSVIKNVDANSPAILAGIINGTEIFPSARLLFYNSAAVGEPNVTLNFLDVLGSAYQLLNGNNLPTERVTFAFASVSAVPEPSFTTLLGIGLLMLAGATWRRKAKRAD